METMNITNIILIIAFAVGIWSTVLIIGKIICHNNVKAHIIVLMALAWTTVITHYLGLWNI